MRCARVRATRIRLGGVRLGCRRVRVRARTRAPMGRAHRGGEAGGRAARLVGVDGAADAVARARRGRDREQRLARRRARAGDSGGGDGERAPRASPPARPRRPRRVGASGASSPGSSSPETAEAAPADHARGGRGGAAAQRAHEEPRGDRRALPPCARRSAADRGADRSLAALRTEASTILRALAAARAAPGGLRGAFGDDPDLLDRLLGALCRAGMLPQAADALRDAIEADAGNEKHIVGKEAVETVVRHAARAGRCRESGALAAFTAFRENARKQSVAGESETEVLSANFPTLRAYTDVISALGKAEARRARRGGGAGGAPAAAPGVPPDAEKTVTDKTHRGHRRGRLAHVGGGRFVFEGARRRRDRVRARA